VVEALAAGHEADLAVLGYGEISLVLGWPPDAPQWACKRLPAFPDRARFDAYAETLDDYLQALRQAGVEPVATEFRAVDGADGRVVGYAVQPVLPADTLATHVLRRSDPSRGHELVQAVVAGAAAAVSPRVGLDAQLANWTWDRGRLTYLDISTPMLWSSDGRLRLDVDVLAQPIPWALRSAIERFLLPGIIDGYRNLRGVYFDLCGNLLKERLDAWLPLFLSFVNEQLEAPMTVEDVERYYRRDKRLWEMLLRIRRLDRAWQRRVRRRDYQFLLPNRVER